MGASEQSRDVTVYDSSGESVGRSRWSVVNNCVTLCANRRRLSATRSHVVVARIVYILIFISSTHFFFPAFAF